MQKSKKRTQTEAHEEEPPAKIPKLVATTTSLDDEETDPNSLYDRVTHMLKSNKIKTEDAFTKLKRLIMVTPMQDLKQGKFNFGMNEVQLLASQLLNAMRSDDIHPEKMRTLMNFMRGQEGLQLTMDHHLYFLESLFNHKMYKLANEHIEEMKRNNIDITWQVHQTMVYGYVRAFKFEYVIELLDQLLQDENTIQPDNYNQYFDMFRTVYDACIKHGDAAKSEQVLYLMDKAFRTNIILYTRLIHLFVKQDNFKKAEEVFERAGSLGMEPTHVTYNTMLQAFIRQHKMQQARRMFDQMRSRQDTSPDIYTFNFLIQGYCRADKPEQAEEVMQMMKLYHLLPNVYSYGTMMEYYVQKHDVDEVEKLMEQMIENNVAPTLAILNMMVKLYMSVNMIEKANTLVETMKQKFNIFPDQSTYTYLSVQYENKQQQDQASDIGKYVGSMVSFRNMEPYSLFAMLKLLAIHPDHKKYTKEIYLFHILQQAKNYRDMQLIDDVVRLMDQLGYKYNAESILQFKLEVYCAKGQVEKAQELLSSFSGIKSAKLLQPLMEAYCNENQIDKAEELLEQLKDAHEESIIVPLIRSLVGTDKLDEAFDMITRMQNEWHVAVTSESFNQLIQYHAEKLDVNHAEKMFQVMLEQKIIPDALSYGLLVYVYHKNETDPAELLERLQYDGHALDSFTLNSILKQFMKQRMTLVAPEKFMQTVAETFGIDPDANAYSCILQGFVNRQDAKQTYKLFKKIPTKTIFHAELVAKVLVAKGKLKKAWKLVMEDLQEYVLKPNVMILNTLKEGYVKKGELAKIDTIVAKMRELAIIPSFWTFCYLTHEYLQSKQKKQAKQTFALMTQCGYLPTAFHFYPIMHEFITQGNIKRAQKVLGKMSKFGIEPDISSYNIFIEYFCKQNDAAEVNKMIDKMVASKMKPSISTFNLMFQYPFHEKPSDAEKLARQLVSTPVPPTLDTFHILLKNYLEKGEQGKAQKVFHNLRNFGLEPSDATKAIMKNK